MKCAKCEEDLPSDGDFVTCIAGCKGGYHFTCSRLKKTTYKAMAQTQRKDWKCESCRPGKQKKDESVIRSSSEPAASQDGTTDQSKCRRGSRAEENVNQEVSVNQNVLLDMNNKLTKMSAEMAGMRVEMVDIKRSLDSMSDSYDDILKEVKELREFKERHINIGTQMKMLENKVHEIEQYGRNRNVEIKGVEELGNEKLDEIVVSIANKCGVTIDKVDIDVVHRISNRNGKEPRDIIAQFKNRDVRDAIMKAKKIKINNKDVTTGKLDKAIYVNEHLSAHYKMLFWETKIKCTEKGYRYVWVKNGKILVRKSDNEQVLRVQNVEDLKKIK